MLRTRLPGADAAEVTESFRFAASAPFPLEYAVRRESGADGTRTITIERAAAGYTATVAGGAGQETQALDTRWTLADHLALERWLGTAHPAAGAQLTAATFDFDRLAPAPAHYVVDSRTADRGWLVQRADDAGQRILDIEPDLSARALTIAGTLAMVRVPTGRMPHGAAQSRLPPLAVALARGIPDPQRAVRMTLAADRRTLAALGAEQNASTLVIDARRTAPVDAAERNAALAATVDLPATSAAIAALLPRLPRSDDPEAQVDLVLALVRSTLAYDDAVGPVALAAALAAGKGDCTEFAALFTTLARALGIPARIVNGLVYAERDGPGFYVHAWSEVALDGRWVAVDPTSGQRPADATHVPFPADATGFLRAYAALPTARLDVVSVE